MVLLRLRLVAEMGFEPHDLRVMSPTSYQTAPLRDMIGAGSRGRTGTRNKSHGILSPGRLPIPPFRQSYDLISYIACILYHTVLEKSIPFAVFLAKKFLHTGFVNIICGFSARYDGKTQLSNKNIKIIKGVFWLYFC